jgi:hypothetical protein
MAIRDKTINQGMINYDLINERLNELGIKLDSLVGGLIPKGIHPTYSDMLVALPTPEDNWYVIIEHDENYAGNPATQYIYYNNVWLPLGGISNINDSSASVKGILRLNGDLTGSAMYPELKEVFPLGGSYAIGSSVVTVDKKGRLLNINVSQQTEWIKIFQANSNDRATNTNTFTVPSYDMVNSQLVVLFCGNELLETRDWIRFDSTTIKTNFTVRPNDDLVVKNIKYQGYLDTSSIINDSVISDVTTYSTQKLNATYYRNDNNLIPNTDTMYNLGSATNRFSNVYAETGTIQTSDIRYKDNVEDCDLGIDFIRKLNPISYNYKDRNRRHYGLSAQALEEALEGKDFGGLIYDKTADMYGIRYEEFIAVLINAIKQQHDEIDYIRLPLWKKFVLKIKIIFNKTKK